MDLNSLQLTPYTLSTLYKDSLITLQNDQLLPMAKEIEISTFKFLGENRKNILVVVNNPEDVHIPEGQLSLLINLLAACKLNLGDVAVFNIYQHAMHTPGEALQFFKCKVIFLFGVEPDKLGLPISFPHFQVQQFNEATYLFSPSLIEIEQDKILKSKLWVCLRRIFNI